MSDMRAALEAIQELHKPVSYWYVSGHEEEELFESREEAEGESGGDQVYEHKVCSHCLEAWEYATAYAPWPCETIKHLEAVLGHES